MTRPHTIKVRIHTFEHFRLGLADRLRQTLRGESDACSGKSGAPKGLTVARLGWACLALTLGFAGLALALPAVVPQSAAAFSRIAHADARIAWAAGGAAVMVMVTVVVPAWGAWQCWKAFDSLCWRGYELKRGIRQPISYKS